MTRGRFITVVGAALAVAAAAAAAPVPTALKPAAPGLWEIEGLPGAKAPTRECVGEVAMLARFEHRSRSCSQKVVRDGASATVIEYSCGGGNFGRSDLKVLTPRSLRIETQGISDGLPFKYVLQARRVGDCAASVSAARH